MPKWLFGWAPFFKCLKYLGCITLYISKILFITLECNGHPILCFLRIFINFVLCSLVLIELDGCVLACHIMWHLQFCLYCIFHDSKDTKAKVYLYAHQHEIWNIGKWSAKIHIGTFDSNFSHISKSYSKFELPYKDGSRAAQRLEGPL